MALSARDTKALLALVEKAQLVYLLTRYPKAQVLGDPADVERLERGLAEMRGAAKDLSAKLREGHAAISWDELQRKPDTPDLAWRRAKRIAPTVVREMVPLLAGVPEAAFFLQPEKSPKTPKGPRKKALAKGARKRSSVV
jgi:hypothetical protein